MVPKISTGTGKIRVPSHSETEGSPREASRTKSAVFKMGNGGGVILKKDVNALFESRSKKIATYMFKTKGGGSRLFENVEKMRVWFVWASLRAFTWLSLSFQKCVLVW